MRTARMAVILWFSWATITTALLLVRPVRLLDEDDRLEIYATVIRDMNGDARAYHKLSHALLDPLVLTPIDQRMGLAYSPGPTFHGQGVIDRLQELGVVAGPCEPELIHGDPSCRGGLAGPVLALSGIRATSSNTVVVSILRRSVRTSHDSFFFGFAVEYAYELVRQGTSWAVTTKTQTMIT